MATEFDSYSYHEARDLHVTVVEATQPESSAILLADERGKYIGYYGTNTNEFYTQSGKQSHALTPSGHENKMHKERVNAFLRRLKQGGTDETESPDDDRREALLDGDGEDHIPAASALVGRE